MNRMNQKFGFSVCFHLHFWLTPTLHYLFCSARNKQSASQEFITCVVVIPQCFKSLQAANEKKKRKELLFKNIVYKKLSSQSTLECLKINSKK